MVDDDDDTDCICSRCTWGGGSRLLEEMDVWKMENVFLLLATLVCKGFLNGHHSVVCPCRCCMSWEGGLKSTPRANPHQYPDVVAITNSRRFSHGKEGKRTLLHQRQKTLWSTLIFLAYLVPEDQSAPQQARGEEREANLWCLQLQKEKALQVM